MISAERLREIEDFPRGANMMRVEAKVLCDAYRELEAARTRIAELINEVAAHHFVRNERDRLLEQLRAQGLSQEDREALERDAARYRWLRKQDGSHGWYTVCGTIYGACRMALLDDLIDAAILRRLGGQTT